MDSPSLIKRFRRVPALLRIVVAASLAIGIGFPFSTLFGGFDYNGVAMSPEELWATGTVWAVLAASPLMLITGLGILYARPWVRPLLVALSFLQYLPFQVAHWMFGAPNPVSSPTFYLVSCVTWALLTVAYLSWWAREALLSNADSHRGRHMTSEKTAGNNALQPTQQTDHELCLRY